MHGEQCDAVGEAQVYWFSKWRDRMIFAAAFSAAAIVAVLAMSGRGVREGARAAELMVAPNAVLFSVGVVVMFGLSVRDGSTPKEEQIGEPRRRAAHRWGAVTLGALVSMPINVITAVSVNEDGPVLWSVPWLASTTMWNVMVWALVLPSLQGVLVRGHSDGS